MEENLTDEELELPDDEISQLCTQKANTEFEILCLEPLRKVAPNLSHAKTSGM